MKQIITKNKGKKLTQIITKTPLEGVKNRTGKQYYTSKTTYIKNT